MEWFSQENLAEIAKWRSRDLDWLKIKTLARHKRVSPGDLEQAIVFFSQPVERPEVVIEPLEAYLARTEPTQYVWDRILPAGSLAILSADPKCGKSVTARNLIYRVSRGETFFGRQTMSGKTPVLYLALEEKAEELRDHFRRLGATNEPIWLYVGPIPLEEALSTLAGEIEKRKARLAVVDPLFDMLSLADTNDYALANRAMKAVLAIGRQTGCHILALHHNSKHGEQGSARSILGSAALRGATDANLTMRKGNNDVRYFATEVRYGEDIVEHEVLYDKRTGEVTLGRSTQSLTEDALRGEVLRRLQNRAQSASELRDGVKKNKGLVGKLLKEMSDEGVLKVIKNGRNVLYAINKGEGNE